MCGVRGGGQLPSAPSLSVGAPRQDKRAWSANLRLDAKGFLLLLACAARPLLVLTVTPLPGGPPHLPLQPELLPVMAVGTAAGSIFLISPDTMTVYAKLRCAGEETEPLVRLGAQSDEAQPCAACWRAC